MIFGEKKSALVRLSDAVKLGLESSAATSREVLSIFNPYEKSFRAAQTVARRAEAATGAELEAIEKEIQAILAAVPEADVWHGATLQGQLHTQVLTTALLCCFCLESYVNSLAYFLFDETDFLGLLRGGFSVSAELLLEAIEQMSTREKWKTISRLKGKDGFDRSRPPFQDFVILFNFRDDHVHDKVVDLSDDRTRKRYNNKFPDPVTGLLTLSHGLYAARTYWSMVQGIHEFLGTRPEDFHRQYNLAPWATEKDHSELDRLAKLYESKIGIKASRQLD